MLAAKLLRDLIGSSKIFLRYWVKGNIANRASNDIIVGRARLYEGKFLGKILDSYQGLSFISGSGEVESDLFSSKIKENKDPLEISVEIPPPFFIIDLRYWGAHREHEKSSLIQQCVLCVSTSRDFLTERNLMFTSVQEDFYSKFSSRVRDFRGDLFVSGFEEIFPKEEVAILDPLGEEELRRGHFSEFKFFVIGGIVDKGNRMEGATSEMGKGFHRIRISLRGSTLGVPDRVNRIFEIATKVFLGESLEEAIRGSQARMIARKRLSVELGKRAIRFCFEGNRYYAISESDYEDLKSFLNFTPEDISRILDRDLAIISDDLAERILRSEWRESYGRKIFFPKISAEDLRKGILARIASGKPPPQDTLS